MTGPATNVPACGRLAAPDRHGDERPVALPLGRSCARRPASTIRAQAGTLATGPIIA